MKTRFYNAKILPMDGVTDLFGGELVVDGDKIIYVGPARAESGAFDREIDCRGNLLLPGFKNVHTHSAMTFLRSYADDLPLHEWLYDRVFPLEAKLEPNDSYVLTRLAILEYLTSGVTAMSDMYFFRDAVAEAAISMGFRAAIMDAVNDYGGSAARTREEYGRINGMSPLVSYKIAIHGEYTTSLPLLRDMAELTQELREPFYSHMNETEREVAECVARYGKRPFEVLDELGCFAYGGNGYHCVHVSEHEMEIIEERGVYAVTCPASNLKLASGVAPVYEFIKRGIPVAIGTDGPASNNCLDMFREMFLVTGLQKLRHGADAVDAMEVLKMACTNGALAMGCPDCDRLAPGKQADIILVDLDAPNMQPLHNIPKNVVYAGSKLNVLLTMVAGNVLYENGEFRFGIDPEKIYAEAEAATRRITGA